MANSTSNPRERCYRRHWSSLAGRVLIGLLGLVAVVWACVTVDLRAVPWLPALALIPLGWLVVQVVWWRSTYLYFDHSRLAFHRWPFDMGLHVNYNFGDWTFDQRSLWAKLWNYGTLRVGQHTFEGYWPFRQLAAALRTPPKPAAPPPPQPGVPPVMPPVGPPDFPSQPVFVFVPIRERIIVRETVVEEPRPTPPILLPWEGDGYVYNDIPFDDDHPSFAGFLAACEEFLFPGRHLDLEVCVGHGRQRRYYPSGMSRHVALFYRELLQRARIIDDEGWLYSRIRDIEDVRQRIPYFEVPRRLVS
jgi:hypothetical protein